MDLVERRYFGNVTHGDIPAVVACFTDDALVTIYHGDAAPRLFKAQPGAGETPLPRFFEHLLANYDPQFTEFVHYVDTGRALRRDLPRHADTETGLVLSRRRRAALAQLQLLPLPGRAHPRDDHLLQQPRHRRRRGGSRRPPHRLSSGLAPGPHHGAMHGMHRPCHHRPCDARERTPPPLPDPLRRSFISLKRRALAPLAWLSHLAVLGGRRGRTGRCRLRSPSALRGEGDRGRWARRLRSSFPHPRPHMLRARPYGRARLCPAESHLSHLIPLNPGKSRLENCVFPRASSTLACAHLVEQGERTALEGFLMLPGVRCARTGPALQSPRRCGLGGPCDRSNDGTVGPRRRTVEAPWRCGSARSSRKPASCIEE